MADFIEKFRRTRPFLLVTVTIVICSLHVASGIKCYLCDSRSGPGQCRGTVVLAKTPVCDSTATCVTVTGNITRSPTTNRTVASYVVRSCSDVPNPGKITCTDIKHDGLPARQCFCATDFCNGDLTVASSTTTKSLVSQSSTPSVPLGSGSASKKPIKWIIALVEILSFLCVPKAAGSQFFYY